MNINKIAFELLENKIKHIDIRCEELKHDKKRYIIEYKDEKNISKPHKITSKKANDINDILNEILNKLKGKYILQTNEIEEDEIIYKISTMDGTYISLVSPKKSNEFTDFKEKIDRKRREDTRKLFNRKIVNSNTRKLLIQQDKDTNKIVFMNSSSDSNNINYHISNDKLEDEEEIKNVSEMINDFIQLNGDIEKVDSRYYNATDVCVYKGIYMKNGCQLMIKGVRLVKVLENMLNSIEDEKKLEMRYEDGKANNGETC